MKGFAKNPMVRYVPLCRTTHVPKKQIRWLSDLQHIVDIIVVCHDLTGLLPNLE